MKSNQDIFIEKLDNFIRKYYQVKILRGLLLTVIFLILLYLGLSVFEYHLYLSSKVKTVLLIVGASLQIIVLIFSILLPLRSLLNKGSRISYRKAITLISAHFPDLEDRLLNTYELNEKASLNSDENALLIASINKRISSLKLLSFRESITFKDTYIYLKYLAGILFLATIIYFAFPDFYSTSSTRLIHFQQDFQAPADFEFIVESELFAEKGENYLLSVHTQGKLLPEFVDLIYGGQKYLMTLNESGSYTYEFRNLNADIQFSFQSGRTKSRVYQLYLKSKPILDKLEINIIPPVYTGLPSRKESQIGDVSIPIGSRLKWFIEAYDADTLAVHFVKKDKFISKDDSKLEFSDVIFESDTYEISLANKAYPKKVYARYQLEVLPDQFPSIGISVQADSINDSAYYFKGVIKDDYGFTKLNFVYQLEEGDSKFVNVPIQKNLNRQEFYFAFDFASSNIPAGSRLQYYFEVFDNDAINKPKSTKSDFLNYYLPNAEQVFELNSHIQDSLTSKIEKGKEISRSIQQKVHKLQKSLLDNSSDQWQQNQMFNEIEAQKNHLENLLKEIKKDNGRKNQLMKAAGLQDSLLLDKQKKIEELMEKIMDDELKSLFEEFNKLSEELDRDKINKLGNQLKMSMNDFQKQLDRNLQLLQRYEIELGVKQISSRIEKLAEEQNELSKFKRKDKESAIGKQVASKMKWERIEKDLDDLLKKNTEINKPFSLGDFNKEKEDIQNSMQESLDQLRDNNLNKAEKSMQNSSQKQSQIAQKLSSAMSGSMSMQMSVDTDMLNKLLINLIDFSFQQEKLILELQKTNYQNPLYVNIIDKQGVLKEEYELLQDSLLSLSSRTPQVAALIGNRIFDLEDLLRNSLDELTNRRAYQARVTQQKSMTEINELAVFLSEALKQLMEQMANGMPGNQMGDKKGNQPSFSGMKAQQESLKKMLEQMIEGMKDGEGKAGNKSEKLGKYLQEQEMFRQKMNDMIQHGGHGEQTDKILKEVMRMMEQTERETSNYSINSQTIKRQNLIMSRLLEAENASREKDFEKKRESKSGYNHKLSNPKEIFKYKKIDTEFDDLLNDSNVKLIDYYNRIYLDYLIQLNNGKIR
ncbi:DUF4175 family protein [Ancylomarina sp. 16SWW S1-10-2]|uniref:DUF4175 family protein n=1 Tax=Ancylomarina sp. 16SWW S1-10-2 TaxID=2499681 RepID=UPI0012AD7EA1|nr:DUF4175 family protein [Ancylomarina sp. 16SWW S1-10-2]MRT93844.1 hypothetical protein [Ancylomarina sp. 16SWW S1-10-2]